MRLVFWNICAGGGVRAERIAAQLVRWAPDVVALCEFRATPPSASVSAALASFGLAHQCTTAEGPSRNANCLLLASRWPLQRLRLRTAPLEPGRWLLATLQAPSPLTVGVMHVPNRVSGRKDTFFAEALRAIRRWRRGPAVLLGDTNTGRPGIDEQTAVFGPREVAFLDGCERSGWCDVFRRLHATKRAYTWYSPNGRNGFRIDQAFVNRELLPRVTRMTYDWGLRHRTRPGHALSDHAALLLDVLDGGPRDGPVFIGGDPDMAPTPPALGAPRRSRGAPR